jgi:hypothetical protein
MTRNLKIFLSLLFVMVVSAAFGQDHQSPQADERPVAKKVLFLGDSMTGWLAERLNAYGKENGFEVATVVWDGSTIKKWGSSPRLTSIISQQDPDAIFISLGMNELFEANPATRLGTQLDAIKGAAGDVPIIWVGPPSWPGHDKGETLNTCWPVNWAKAISSAALTSPCRARARPIPTPHARVW